MKFMMMIKANARSEAGVLPNARELEAMGKYNAELIKAGVMLDGVGLQASSKGARVRFSNGKPSVIDGPFAEAKELVAGFWIIQVKSRDEAIEWAKRVPFDPQLGDPGGEGEIELRQIFEPGDFGEAEEAHDKHVREAQAQAQKSAS